MLSAVILGIFKEDKTTSTQWPILIAALFLVAFMAVLANFMLAYLRQDDSYNAHDAGAGAIERQINRLLQTSFVKSKLNVTDEDKQQLLDQFKASVNDNFKQELVAEIESKYAKAIAEQLHADSITGIFENTRRRLLDEIDALGRRGNLNLVLGTITSFFGIMTLMYVVLIASSGNSNDSVRTTDTSHFLISNIPRITLVLFMQLLGFFFLKLYRSGLETIKYFQNELTNVELKFLSLTAAMMSKNEKSLASLVANICKTERNFLLLKGQSTVEIEKTKLDNIRHDDSVAVLGNLLTSLIAVKKDGK